MPLRYVIDKRRRLIFCVVWGCLTYAEARAAHAQLIKDPDFDPSFDELVDGTAQTALQLTADEARQLANQAIYSPTSKRAWVSSNPAMYGMSRLIATHHQMMPVPPTVNVFYNMAEAVKWLGLDSLVDNIPPQVEKNDRESRFGS